MLPDGATPAKTYYDYLVEETPEQKRARQLNFLKSKIKA
jgi:hypothetical protein